MMGFVVYWTDPALLSCQNLEDKCLHNEGYHNFKNHQGCEVETQEVDSR